MALYKFQKREVEMFFQLKLTDWQQQGQLDQEGMFSAMNTMSPQHALYFPGGWKFPGSGGAFKTSGGGGGEATNFDSFLFFW